MKAYPYEEQMEEMVLDDERGIYWKIVFEENDGGRYYQKSLLHDNRWYVYIIDKISLIKDGYSV